MHSTRIGTIGFAAALALFAAACGTKSSPPAGNAAAAANGVDAKAVHEMREANFKKIGKNNKAIGEEVKKAAPDAATIQASAKAIAALARELPSWFPAGTGPDVNPETHALPAVWTNNAAFLKKADALRAAAEKLDTTAAGGDKAAIAAAANDLGATCKACHTEFRAKKD